MLVIISNPFSFKFQLVVMRGGRTVKISIYNVVFGDVPADGVLISGHSLAIDESNMTCESKIRDVEEESQLESTLVTNQREVEDTYFVVV
ncbi:hypothetical protein HID58_053711 [Brassica napus]|uniref:P-type ATPase A domain-containing protein n=1 Tax=Brassica napus TaxID=3708 RepID=A0ABQ8AFG0_BRANA|nr:hypothetical protein HID58_053711 [Brassica napus]